MKRAPRECETGKIQIGSLIGVIGIAVCLTLGALWGKSDWGRVFLAYIDIPAIFITIGGTTFSFLFAFTPAEYRGVFTNLKHVFTVSRLPAPTDIVPTLVSIAEKARREGLLALEDDAQEITDDFLRRALQLIIDGTDPEMVRNVMRIRIDKLEDRHNANLGPYAFIEARAPAFGLIGTILGLVQLLRNLSDPAALGPSLAIALLTTFYGVIIANAFMGPIQTRLSSLNDHEVLLRNLMLEGLMSIQSGDNPHVVEEKLLAFIAMNETKKYENGRDR